MEKFKVLKAKAIARMQKQKEAHEKRKMNDIEQYLEDAKKEFMTAIELMVISKDKYFLNRSNINGRHAAMEEAYIGQETLERITEGKDRYYLPALMAEKLGMVVVELGGPMNGGIITISYPDDINDYQLDMLEDLNRKIEKANSSSNDDYYKYNVIILDPDTGHKADSLQEAIDKLRGRNRSK